MKVCEEELHAKSSRLDSRGAIKPRGTFVDPENRRAMSSTFNMAHWDSRHGNFPSFH